MRPKFLPLSAPLNLIGPKARKFVGFVEFIEFFEKKSFFLNKLNELTNSKN